MSTLTWNSFLFFNFLNQHFITWDAVVDHGSYNVTTYIEQKRKNKKKEA